MLKGVVMQGFVWKSYEALFWPTCSSSKRVYPMPSDMPGEERSGESKLHDQGYTRGGKVN